MSSKSVPGTVAARNGAIDVGDMSMASWPCCVCNWRDKLVPSTATAPLWPDTAR